MNYPDMIAHMPAGMSLPDGSRWVAWRDCELIIAKAQRLYEVLDAVRHGLSGADDAFRFGGTISVIDSVLTAGLPEDGE